MNCYDNAVFNFIGELFGYILSFFYNIFKNYGLAIVFFTIFTRVIMFPLTIKQQKQMAAQQRIQPKLNELKEKYGNNKELYNTEVQKLYEKEGVKMSMGCGSMLIQFPLFIGMYMAVRKPLSNVLHVGQEAINSLCGLFGIDSANNYYAEVNLLSRIRDVVQSGIQTVSGSDVATATDAVVSAADAAAVVSNTDLATVTSILGDKADVVAEMSQKFNFLGFDLLQIASFKPFNSAMILAILVFIAQVASMYISNKINKIQSSPTPGCSPNMMAVFMGAFSFWISLSIPAAFPLYWLTTSLISPVQTWVTKKYYGPIPMNARAEAARNAMLREDEAKVIESIEAKKGRRALKPCEPAEKITGSGIQGGSAKNRSGGNRKKKKK